MKKLVLFALYAGIHLHAGSQQLQLIKDINPGSSSSNISYLTVVGNTLFFAANNGVNGMELWKSDGTGEGTVMVKDINGGSANSSIGYLINGNGTLFFVASNGVNGTELWKSDGTAAGTVMIKDIRTGSMSSNPSDLFYVNGFVFFAANDGIHGTELWKSDGTDAGTVMVKDINSAGSAYPSSLSAINNELYFSADDGTNGQELWKSDGTAAGTTMVKDLWPGINSGFPSNLVNVAGTIFFSATNGTSGAELWKTDGTGAGTQLVKDIRTGSSDSNPFNMKDVNGTLFFSADNGSNGVELWKSNGTASGTVMVKDVWPGSASGATGNFSKLLSQVVFTGNDGVNGYKTWQSDGSVNGTVIATGIANTGSGSLQELKETNSYVFASISQTETGRELWGTSFNSVLPLSLIAFNGRMENNVAVLNWKTEQESNSEKFFVERSSDGVIYNSIGIVSAYNSPGTHSYTFSDPAIGSLGRKTIFYRLRPVDIDGRFTYSGIVALAVNEKSSLVTLFPNPVSDNLNLLLSISREEMVKWQIVDISGRVMMQEEKQLSPGTITIKTTALARGVYYISMQGNSFNCRLPFVKNP